MKIKFPEETQPYRPKLSDLRKLLKNVKQESTPYTDSEHSCNILTNWYLKTEELMRKEGIVEKDGKFVKVGKTS